MNEGLKSFVIKLCGSCPDEERKNVQEVLKSLDRCPIQLNFDDAKDLIGVNPYIERKLEDFFNGKHKYIPKENSAARLILQILYNSKGGGLTKPDIMREMGYKQPPITNFNKGKNYSFGPLSSMKTLESHELVFRVRASSNKHQFSLTDSGRELCEQLFNGAPAPENPEITQIVPRSCKILVKRSEIEYRTTFDVFDALRRTGRTYTEEKTLPVGSIWFSRNDEIYDTVIQFVTYGNLSNGKDVKKVSASPFTNKIIIVPSKENANYAQTKLQVGSDYNVRIVFLDTPAAVSQFLDETCNVLDRCGVCIGGKKEVIALCEKSKYSKKVGDVWQQVLNLFPHCGPQMAAKICNRFSTPDSLYQYVRDQSDQAEAFRNAVAETGQRPRDETAQAIVKLFGHN